MTRLEELQARVVVFDQDSLNALCELTAIYEAEIERKDAALRAAVFGADELRRVASSALTPATET